jgi:putative hydrolase of the HAD superfamily
MEPQHATLDALRSPRATPRALLLDFGSVISVSMFERHPLTERVLNLPPGTLTWMGPLDPQSDPLWQALQREELSHRDYWMRRARELGAAVNEPDWDLPTMFARIHRTEPNNAVRPEMRQLIGRARAAGIRTGILSNELELFYGSDMVERIDVLREIDVIVDCSDTEVLKPDPRAYALAVQELQCPAAAVLFVDDQLPNVVGALRAGLQAQFFDLRNVAGSIAAIEARLELAAEDGTPL